MAADRVPVAGEVWALPHLHREPLRRGRVVILAVADDMVTYRYVARDGEVPPVELRWFVANYDRIADNEEQATDLYGPQLRPGQRRLIDMPIRLGTAVD